MADSLKSADVPSVTGMVVVNPDGSAVGAPVGGATSDNQTNGSQKSQIVDAGGEAVTVTGGKLDVNASVDTTGLATSAKQDDIITAIGAIPGGGGTQYTEGDTDATITGTAALVEGAANALAVMTQPLTDTQLRASDVKITLDGESVPVTNAGITTIAGAVSGTEMQVDVLTMPTTAVTNAGITTIAGAVSGTEMQVDVLTMPTTTVTATDLDIRPLVNTDVVTAELSAVDNAVLDTIAAKDFATQTTLSAMNAKMVSGTDIGDVTINNSTGAAAVNIQDGGNTITVDGTVAVTNSDITSIKTAVEIIDNAISGSEMQVDVVGALPAGTNAIGKLAANSGVDIGDVTLTAGTAAIGSILPPDTDVTAHTNYARKYYTNAGAVTDGIVWSPAAGKRWHVVTMYIQTSAAATITLEDDKAGGDDPVWKGEIAANSGVTLSFTEHYPMASGEDAADLLVTTSAGNVYITAVGYEL